MIHDWLKHSERSNHSYKFKVIDLSETEIRKQELFPQWLAEELLMAYKNPNHLKRRYSKKDKSELRKYLADEVFPPLTKVMDKNVRRGDWGEIVSSLFLRDVMNLETALIKLRYKLNRKKSSFGIDVFGVQLDDKGNVCGLCVCETKTKITYDKQIGVKAHDSLYINDISSIITIADFMSTLYFEQGKYELSDQFDEIVINNGDFPTDHHIFLVHEKKLWNDDILSELNNLARLSQDLHFNVLLIDELNDFADYCFSIVPDVGEEIVYGTNRLHK